VKQTLLATVAGLALAIGGMAANANAACPLTSGNGPIKHIVYLQFDNTHYLRDAANIPSDLEQMPALLAFLTQKGTLSANNHTQIISHTANGILSSITGVYPDRIGSAVANSFGYYKQSGTVGFQSDFTYWTNIIDPTNDPSHVLIAETGKNAPAPWAAFTKAGCDFGAVALADMEFENTTTDIANAFAGTALLAPAQAESAAQRLADYEGIAIHCAQGSTLCSAANNGVADKLPDEPGGYTGYNALFGHKFVAPAINHGASTIPDLLGGTISGFPNFDGMWPKVTGAYVAQMLEAGVPVVYGYLSDAHDNHANTSAPQAYGPGEAGYVQQLANYNAGFAAFFARLKAHGIDETNTLFVITVEEGDHFAGKVPPGCANGSCTYSRTKGNVTIGEVDVDLTRLMQANNLSVPGIVPASGSTVGFDTHYDMAPAFYVYNNPDPESAAVRQFEQDVARLTLTDPVTNTTVPLAVGLADRAEMRLLHMYGSGGNVPDPLRLPSFVAFASPDFYVETYYASLCSAWTSAADYACEQPSYAWNHGGIQSQVATTWLGIVGPGVINKGLDKLTWTDHTDIRPTILTLAGLKDSYLHDGRVLVEHLKPEVLPPAIAINLPAYVTLANAYKQLNAPFGATGLASITYATNGIATTNAATHAAYLAEMAKFNATRDNLVAQIRSYIEAAAFSNGPFNPATAVLYAAQAEALTLQMQNLAARAH
jgi:hypothetical protein